MRVYIPLLILSNIFLSLLACKKEKLKYKPSAALIVTTAVVSGGNVKLNANERDSAKAYNSKLFGIIPGNTNIVLYATNDPAKPYYSNVQQTDPGEVYSVFLGGRLPSVDAVFVKESTIAYYTDSSIGIRIINLSPNSMPINITLASDTTKNIFFKIAYKQLTDIVKLPLRSIIPTGSVTFQVRDNISNTIQATYSLPTSVNALYPNISTTLSRNRNLTLVIKGLQGTTSGFDLFGVFPVANY